jgi:hypothetical protein
VAVSSGAGSAVCTAHAQDVPSVAARFVAVDRGVLRYPTYGIRRTSPVYPDRQALLEYEQALQLAAQVEEALEVRNIFGC